LAGRLTARDAWDAYHKPDLKCRSPGFVVFRPIFDFPFLLEERFVWISHDLHFRAEIAIALLGLV
jgi:hypothetical protein